jgi:hypothetical protein
MRKFLEELAIIIISIIQATAIMMLVILCVTLSLGKKKDIIGTNMNNETKEYVRISDDSYGVTEDGTRELLKSYKFKK